MLARLTAILTQVICDCIRRLRNVCWQTPSYMSPGPLCPKSLPTNHPWTSSHLRPRYCSLHSKYRRQTTDLNISLCKSPFLFVVQFLLQGRETLQLTHFCWIDNDVEGVHPYPEHRALNATRHAHIFWMFRAILRTWWWLVFISCRYKYIIACRTTLALKFVLFVTWILIKVCSPCRTVLKIWVEVTDFRLFCILYDIYSSCLWRYRYGWSFIWVYRRTGALNSIDSFF